jgi:15-cis-phytoene synthase
MRKGEMRAFAAAGELCRRRAPEVQMASFFLPKERRGAVLAAAGFVVMMGDAVRGALGGAEQRGSSTRGETGGGQDGGCCGEVSGEVVGLLRERIDEIYAGAVDLPPAEERTSEQWVLDAFGGTAALHQIPRAYLDELLEGLVAEQTTARYATWASLGRQLGRTGGAAAGIMCSVLGVRSSDAMGTLGQIGVAGDLTRLLMNVRRDAGVGRVRLPLEDLVRFRCSEREVLGVGAECGSVTGDETVRLRGGKRPVAGRGLKDVVRFEVERAEALYREGEEGIGWLATDGGRLFAAAMSAQGRGLLREIRRRGFDVMRSKPRLTHVGRLRMLPEVWRLARG